MQNFSEYIKSNKDNVFGNNNADKERDTLKNNEAMQNKINEYSGYSSDRLINEFMKLTLEKKRKGELSDSELEKLKNTIEPMLNAEQKKSLESLLKMVKNVK